MKSLKSPNIMSRYSHHLKPDKLFEAICANICFSSFIVLCHCLQRPSAHLAENHRITSSHVKSMAEDGCWKLTYFRSFIPEFWRGNSRCERPLLLLFLSISLWPYAVNRVKSEAQQETFQFQYSPILDRNGIVKGHMLFQLFIFLGLVKALSFWRFEHFLF